MQLDDAKGMSRWLRQLLLQVGSMVEFYVLVLSEEGRMVAVVRGCKGNMGLRVFPSSEDESLVASRWCIAAPAVSHGERMAALEQLGVLDGCLVKRVDAISTDAQPLNC